MNTPLIIHIPCQLTTLNKERNQFWANRHTATKTARQLAWAVTKQTKHPPITTPVHITATPHQTTNPLADPGAHYPTIKATIDGLVDAKLIPNDTGKHIHSITLNAPQPAENEGITLTITTVQ